MGAAERKDPRVDLLLTRRNLLQVGGVGILGLGLPELLHAGQVDTANRSRKTSETS